MTQNTTKSYPTAICPLCNTSANIITDKELNEIICSNCGRIITDIFKDRETLRNSTKIEKVDTISKVRTVKVSSTSLSLHYSGLSTVIGKTNRDASGQQIDTEMISRINRLRVWDTRSQIKNYKERSLHVGLIQIQRLKDKLRLTDPVIEKTAYIYRKIQQRGLVNGLSIKLVIIAALYITCREMEIPRTLKELAEISNVDEKDLSRCYRKVIIELDLKVPQADPLKMIVKISNICKISEKSKRCALMMMDQLTKRKLFTSKDPMGLAGAIVYMAGKINGEHIIQYQIANATGLTLITLRKNLGFLEEYFK